VRAYYENGQLQQKSNFTAGELDGPFERYGSYGQLMRKGTYNMGEMCGEWIREGEIQTHPPC
jgi:antitoxin component YwqK of YwqJK toxin-antitoxin module